MPDNTPQIQITDYEAAIKAAITTRFPIFNTVEPFPEQRLPGEIVLPACLFEITEMEGAPSHDGGAGQTPLDVRVEMHLLFSFKTTGIKKLLPAIAANVLQFIHLQRWGLLCEPCEILGASPDTLNPELEQFALWRLEFHQVIDVGDNVWANDPDLHVPTQVFIAGITPMPADEPGLPAGEVLPPGYDYTPPAPLATPDNSILYWLE